MQGTGNRRKLKIQVSRALKSTKIRGVPKSEVSGSQNRGDKGGGEEGRSGGRVNRAWRGKRGEKRGEKGERKGAQKHTRPTVARLATLFRATPPVAR